MLISEDRDVLSFKDAAIFVFAILALALCWALTDSFSGNGSHVAASVGKRSAPVVEAKPN